jgi:dephospho-CoA kinase
MAMATPAGPGPGPGPGSGPGSGPGPRLRIGLTGGIGCGKSTVSDLFAARGASIVDTDLIAHALTAPGGAAMADLRATFGDGVADASGAMDRARMRSLVFSDAAAKQQLEAILHPRIRSATLAAAEAATGPYVLLVVPLLIEAGHWREQVQRVLAIDCPETLQVARVMARNGMTEAQVRAIMATQVSRAARRAAADDLIVNDAGIDALEAQIAALHLKYMEISERMA